LAAGLYLPMLRSEQCGHILVAVDTSGSIDDVTLSQFAAEINAIMNEAQPERITVVYCDARVQHVDTFYRGDIVTLTMHGGGGTDFRPVFDHVAAMDESPIAIVYLTDLEGTFPSGSEVPTLWVATSSKVAPFGETVNIQ
jgi:predicted metal-dependent peptidase